MITKVIVLAEETGPGPSPFPLKTRAWHVGNLRFCVWLRWSSQFQGATCTDNIGAFMVRIGFWGTLYYNHVKEPPK